MHGNFFDLYILRENEGLSKFDPVTQLNGRRSVAKAEPKRAYCINSRPLDFGDYDIPQSRLLLKFLHSLSLYRLKHWPGGGLHHSSVVGRSTKHSNIFTQLFDGLLIIETL